MVVTAPHVGVAVATIGNTLGGNGVSDRGQVRVFSEGVPSNETPAEANTRRSVGGENDSASRQLARFIKEMGESYVPQFKVMLVYRRDRYGRGGDHIPFLERGYPAVRFTEVHEDFRHQHQNLRVENGVQFGDLPEFVDSQYTANIARINLIAIASMAKAPAAPQNVQMQVKLGNITYLSWSPPASGPKVSGYYVLMRETIQPYWEKKFFVTDTKAALPYSKDNHFFAVQSVGEHGHISTAVMPVPVRE